MNNTDEQVVLDAKVFAFYKGRLVVRHSVPETTSCAIFGTIFLNRSETSSNPASVQVLKHEYGHTVQESILGTRKYIEYVAIPSLRSASVPYRDYYSLPWERTADAFGGAHHDGGSYIYHSNSFEAAWKYFDMAFHAK